MLKTQIIVTDLNNLTDARYFAAWGVDYMAFNCNPGEDTYVEALALKEIKEWVEGPHFLGMFNGLSPASDIEEQVEMLKLDGLILGQFTPRESIDKIDAAHLFVEQKSPDASAMIDKNTILAIDKKSSRNYFDSGCFLNISDLDLETVKSVLEHSYCGLVLRGGDEEKVGFKSYDFLDEVFELLMD